MLGKAIFGLDRDPTYKFAVGDIAYRGNAPVQVLEVSNDAKTYVVTRAFEKSDRRSTVLWHELRRADKYPAVTMSHLTRNRDVRLYFSNQELRSLIHTYYTFGIDTEPAYQRGYEWTLDDKRRLIESIFMGADIGRFLLNEQDDVEVDQPIYEVIDGKQRLLAIIDFYEDRFDYQGYTFSMLSKDDTRTFLGHTISVGKLMNAGPKTVLKCFLMMNRGGVPVDKKHLKKVELQLERMEFDADSQRGV